jgi:molecular chaperone DnaK (HSP70)
MSDTSENLVFALDAGAALGGAVDKAGWPRILADSYGKKVIPAFVSFHPDGSILVGEEAKAQRAEDPANTMSSLARLAGLKASAREIVEVASRAPYAFRVGPDDTPLIATRAGDFSIPDLLSLLVDHMRRLATFTMDADVRRCVLTVPAFYGAAQREGMIAAATLAGLTVEGVLDDPVAAALAYGYSRATQPIVCVYDFGGGKIECTVLEVKGDEPRVLGTSADVVASGDATDARVVDYTMRAFYHVQRVDLRADPSAPPRLAEAAERAKWDLSAKNETLIAIPHITQQGGRAIDLSLTLTREIFAQATDDLVKRTLAVASDACAKAGLAPGRVDEVLLLGGMTKLPWVRDQVGALFGKQPRTDVNPDAGVALGAALWGARFEGRTVRPSGEQAAVAADDSFRRRITSQFGSDTQQTQPSAVVPRSGVTGQRAKVGRINTKKMFTAAMAVVGEPSFTPVQPVKAQIAEVMASKLGISTVGGFCDEVIPGDSILPAEKTRVFSTGKDNQVTVRISVCQGDSRRFAENVSLGTIVLENLPPRPRGGVKIAVSFAVDTEGVLVASARDEESGKAQTVRIQLGTEQG